MAEETGGNRALIFLLAALVLGGGALYGVFIVVSNLQAQIAEAERPDDTVMAIVAARDLFQGLPISEEDLFAVSIPPEFLPPNVYLDPDHVIGRVPRERILANEFIREERLADARTGIGLNAIIPRGMRALSINISEGRALSGFLNPENYVDLLLTLSNTYTNEKETQTLLEAVFVLAVNDRASYLQDLSEEERKSARGPKRTAPSVTLAVTPEQAETIANAERIGAITLTLRHTLDVGPSEEKIGPTTVDSIAPKPKPVPKPKPKPKPAPDPKPAEPTLQIIKGSGGR